MVKTLSFLEKKKFPRSRKNLDCPALLKDVETLSFLEKKKFPCAARRTPKSLGQSRKNLDGSALLKDVETLSFLSGKNKLGQMKIQQMAFMLVAVFFFFILVGLFFLRVQFSDIQRDAAALSKDSAISSLEVIANMPELNCDSRKNLCLDVDKLKIMSGNFGENYNSLWPVASVRVYTVYPESSVVIKCPAVGCNYYEIWDNGQQNSKEFSTYVSVCEKIKESGYVYDNCEIAKLVVGVLIRDES